MPARRITRLLALALALSWLAPSAALANMAQPDSPGDALGEPGGELSEVHIEREELVLDLRPLADAEPVAVTATYHLRNDGAERSVELVFVATAMSDGDSGVRLDGAPVEFTREQTDSTAPPPSIPWRPPSTTPGLGGGNLFYSARYQGLMRFTLALSPGSHEIQVNYTAQASAYSGDSQARYWQLGYVLAPARQWASFGTLNVLVQLPPGWLFASSPPLERTGDEARGSFTGVPADSLAITSQWPVNRAEPISWSLVGIAVALGLALAALVGLFIGRRNGRPRNAWPVSLAYSVVAAFVTVFLGGMFVGRSTAVPASQSSWSYLPGLGQTIVDLLTLLISFPLLAVVLFLLMQLLTAMVARRTASRAPTPPQPT